MKYRGWLSRRDFFRLTGTGALAGAYFTRLDGQQPPTPVLPLPAPPIVPVARRSTVSLIHGEDRRKNVYDALVAVDADIRPRLKQKKYVVIKPNITNYLNALAATHADTLRGILDYLEPRFKGPIVVAESASSDTLAGYENLKYTQVASEHRSQKVSLIDLNVEGRFMVMPILSANVHPVPVRMAERLFDPDAFIINATIPKTHESIIATLSVKNMVVGGALRSVPAETTAWSDKRKFHAGGGRVNLGAPSGTSFQQMHYNIALGAQRMAPYWGATVLDAFEGMEGSGPVSGTAIPARIAIASTDYIAADRVGLDTMGIDANWIGYLVYCGQIGLGNYDLAKIDIRGASLDAVRKTYKLHPNTERELRWMGPLNATAGD